MAITDHPDSGVLESRVQKLTSRAASVSRHVFRVIEPEYYKDHDIVSGVGGLRSSGRWNLKKRFRCSYTSDTLETAVRETLAASRRKNLPDSRALPRALVCVGVQLQQALDLTDGQVRQACRVSEKRMVGERWWSENFHDREALTQALGRAAASVGFEGIVAPSAADRPHGVNVIVFPDNLLVGSRVDVITPIRWK
jgi:RES domain-containing protein